MLSLETADQFFQRQGNPQLRFALQHVSVATTGRLNVYDRALFCNRQMGYSRRDFFKIYTSAAVVLKTAFCYEPSHRLSGVGSDRPALAAHVSRSCAVPHS